MISIKPLEVIWFENISAFNEPVLGLGPIRASMKQLLYTMLALALAFSILNIAKNLILAVPIAGFLLLLAYAKPYGQNMEVLLIDMVSFFGRKKSTGAVEAEGKKVKKEEKDKDKKKVKEEVETVVVEEAIPLLQTSPIVAVEAGIEAKAEREHKEEKVTTPEPLIPTNKTANLLHYIVPSTRDLNLELVDNDCIIATGESTIHIAEDISNAIIVIEVKNKAIRKITVNNQLEGK